MGQLRLPESIVYAAFVENVFACFICESVVQAFCQFVEVGESLLEAPNWRMSSDRPCVLVRQVCSIKRPNWSDKNYLGIHPNVSLLALSDLNHYRRRTFVFLAVYWLMRWDVSIIVVIAT